MLTKFKVIVAVNKSTRGIGYKGSIPWKIKEDMTFFKELTTGNKNNAVIMGRKTYESIPAKFRPLTNRVNIILTRNHTVQFENATTVHSFEEALKFAAAHNPSFENVFIIGGSEIYNLALSTYKHLCTDIYITWVNDSPKYICDTFFPWNQKDMNVIASDNCDLITNLNFTVTKYTIKMNMIPNLPDIKLDDLSNIHPEYEYLKLCNEVLNKGEIRPNRTTVETLSIFGTRSVYDLSETFPLLTTKKMFWKGIVNELLFFLHGKTDTKELETQGVNIWKNNTTKEFLHNRGLSWAEGDMGPGYGFQWRYWGAEYKGAHVDYTGKGIDQLATIIDGLKTDPFSRRHILSAWNVQDLNKMALPPCHVSAQFNVSTNNQLSCMLYQRSADLFLGVPFNIASYALLTLILCKITGYTPGKLIHIIGDCHIYTNHVDAIREQISRVPYPWPKVEIIFENTIQTCESIQEITKQTQEITNLENLHFSQSNVQILNKLTEHNVKLVDYVSHDKIVAPMVV